MMMEEKITEVIEVIEVIGIEEDRGDMMIEEAGLTEMIEVDEMMIEGIKIVVVEIGKIIEEDLIGMIHFIDAR